MANISDQTRNEWMLKGTLSKKGYDWWWHSFTGTNERTGERKSFFIEFYTINPAYAKKEPMIVWHDENKRNQGFRPSYVMVKAGFWGEDKAQINNFYPWSEVRIKKNAPFFTTAGDCYLGETGTVGKVSVSKEEAEMHPEWMSDSGEMEWNLSINKEIAYNVGYGANSFFRKINAFEMFWHAEGMKTSYEGFVIAGGEKYIVTKEDSYGYADKNWGSDFTSPWVWLSSNNLLSASTGEELKNSVFNIGGGRPKAFGIALDSKLLGELYYEGEEYEFNFSKVFSFSRTKFKCRETKDEIIWNISQKRFGFKLVTNVICKKSEMLLMNYESPDGYKRHNRLWNGGTGIGELKLYRTNKYGRYVLVDRIYAKNVGCEYGEY